MPWLPRWLVRFAEWTWALVGRIPWFLLKLKWFQQNTVNPSWRWHRTACLCTRESPGCCTYTQAEVTSRTDVMSMQHLHPGDSSHGSSIGPPADDDAHPRRQGPCSKGNRGLPGCCWGTNAIAMIHGTNTKQIAKPPFGTWTSAYIVFADRKLDGQGGTPAGVIRVPLILGSTFCFCFWISL